MKRILLMAIILVFAVSCRKNRIEPEGPTDVRVYNNTDQVFTNLLVNTSGGEFNYGTLAPHTYSQYHRFDKAYPKADISLMINGEAYSTPKQDYTYMQYMGQMKMTYKIYIKNPALRELDTDVVPEGDL